MVPVSCKIQSMTLISRISIALSFRNVGANFHSNACPYEGASQSLLPLFEFESVANRVPSLIMFQIARREVCCYALHIIEICLQKGGTSTCRYYEIYQIVAS